VPIGDDTFAYRRMLPHLQREQKTYYVTFCMSMRRALNEEARDIVLEGCVRQHLSTMWLHCVVVMPDHVHLLLTLYPDVRLEQALRAIKGTSARLMNARAGRAGSVWQRESFDHILRSDESRAKKVDYIAHNPVRAALAERPEQYRWLWINEQAG
jgi:REP element-mobilizing transposase RayT